MFRNICTLVLLQAVSARIQIDFDDEKIKKTATEVAEWADFTAHSDEAREIVSGLNHFVNKAQWEIGSRQKELLLPFVENLKLYLKYLNPDEKKCNAEGFIECSVAGHEDNYWDALTTQCAFDNRCQIRFDDLSEKRQLKIAGEFMANHDETEYAMRRLRDSIEADFMNIAVENRHNAGILAESVREEYAHVAKQWGCDAACVDSCTANMDVFSSGACRACSCPKAINIRHTPNAVTPVPPAQVGAILKAMRPAGQTNLICDIPELCDGNGHFVGAVNDPCSSDGGLYDIPELCDENGHFVGKSINPAEQVLVCDIPELCDENGHFVGEAADGPNEHPECDIPELCDENGHFVGSSITVPQAARQALSFDFGGEISQPVPGKVETGTVSKQHEPAAPELGMFYGIGLKQVRPQSFVFLSDHKHLFQTKNSEIDMFAMTFGMISKTLQAGALGAILLALALVTYSKTKSSQNDDSEHFRVELDA